MHPVPAGARGLPDAVALSPRRRLVLAVIELLVGFGALFGGYGLLTDAERLGVKESWLDGSPFADYTVPGVVLLVVVGGGLLIAAALAVTGRPAAAGSAVTMGVVLLVWGIVETLTVGWRGPTQLVLVGAFVVAPAAVLIGIGRAALCRVNRAPEDRATTAG